MLFRVIVVLSTVVICWGQERGKDGFIRLNGGCGTRPGGKVCSILSLGYPGPAPAGLRQTWSFLSAEDNQYTALKMTCHHISLPQDGCKEYVFKLQEGREEREWCGEEGEFTLLTKKDYVRFALNTGTEPGGSVNCSIWAVAVTEDGQEIANKPRPITTTPAPSNINRAPLPPYLLIKSEERDSSEQGVGPGNKPTTCPCGWTNKASSRIVQGSFTEQNEFPWMAIIMETKSKWIFCGGSVISSNHVLTAAHCTDDAHKKNIALTVILGAHDTKKPLPGISQIIEVKKIIQHDEYTPSVWKNDISLLSLKSPVNFTPYVGRVCLPTGQMNLGRSYVKIMGWGSIYAGGPSSSVLKKVDVRVVPIAECNSMYKNVDPINSTQICTFARSRASCQGDSGGPVVWFDPEINRFTLVGLVSFGRVCADISPSVHTEVAFYLPWIHQQIEKSHKDETCTKK